MIFTLELNFSIGGDDIFLFVWFFFFDFLVLEIGLLLFSGIVSNFSLFYVRSLFYVYLKYINMSYF